MPVYNGVQCVATVELADDSGSPTIIGKRKKIEWNGSKEFTSEGYQGEEGSSNTPGAIAYEGSLTFHHDPTDAGQTIIIDSFKSHALLRFVIMPVGNAAGKRAVTFAAFITDDPNNVELEANVEKTMGLKIEGIPVESTVGA